MALVVQGGALRGAYAVGALRTLYEEVAPERFANITTVSASVFACAYFVAHQVEHMENTWRDLVHGSRLVRLHNVFRAKPVMDLDYLIELFRGPVWLDLGRVAATPVDLRFVLSNYRTGAAEYVRPTAEDAFTAMRASCALPGLYPIPVAVRGGEYYDGGHSDPLPLEYVLGLGFRRVLVIMTKPRTLPKRPPKRWGSAVFIRDRRARGASLEVHHRYNRALEILASPPAGVRIDVIAPDDLPVDRLARSREAIIGAIERGKRDTRAYLAGVPLWAGSGQG
jgi:predicted patatin/cPLA2 family phospholipase